MKITLLKVSDFLKLKDVEINPTHTNIIVGKNKQGKTSILKAIMSAMTGKLDASDIRQGAEKAEILVDLGKYKIKRSVTEKGAYVDVTTEEGFKVPSPQKFLTELFGSTVSFNPIEFFELKPLEQKKYLLNAIDMRITQEELAKYTGEQLAGLDYEGTHALEIIAQAKEHYYTQRTTANATITQKKKVLEDLNSQLPDDFDPAAVNTTTIEGKRTALADFKRNADLLAMKKTAEAQSMSRIEKLKADLAEEEATLTGIQEEIVSLDEKQPVEGYVAQLEEEIATLESQRDLVHTAERREEVRAELSTVMAQQEVLDAAVKKLDKEAPADLMAKAKLPVEGLTIGEEGILVNDLPLANLSTSEQLRFAVQIVRQLNDQFKVILVDGVEALDADTFAQFLKEIEDDDFQYFLTRVDTGVAVPHSIVMEDGEVKEESTEQSAA